MFVNIWQLVAILISDGLYQYVRTNVRMYLKKNVCVFDLILYVPVNSFLSLPVSNQY